MRSTAHLMNLCNHAMQQTYAQNDLDKTPPFWNGLFVCLRFFVFFFLEKDLLFVFISYLSQQIPDLWLERARH